MIPKVIHYCWFGGNPKPTLFHRCYRSWKKFCPDYQIIEWNESNYPLQDAPLYVRQAYEAKKWAFVTDYVRLQVVYENGGIYLDTDVELVQPLEKFLRHRAYFGLEEGEHINTGLGFGAEQGVQILRRMMEDYQEIPFIRPDSTFDETPCPVRNTAAFLEKGLKQDDSMQVLDGDVLILPSEFLCPKDWKSGRVKITEKTHSIHHCSASWYTPEMRRALKKRQRDAFLCHLPSTLGNRLLGKERYDALRKKLKR